MDHVAPSALELPVIWQRPAAGRPDGETPGDPPVATEAGRLRVWCSGFIANRSELLAAGGLAADASDAEIFAALFRRHGVDAARRIAGTLSWILLDSERRELFAGRDRAGTGSVYYSQAADRLVLAERVARVRSHLEGEVGLNLRALVARCHGVAPPPGETAFAEIRSLEPGGRLFASAAGLRIDRYWQLDTQRSLRLRSDTAYAEALRELLFTVVAQYRPAGPCAVALSSGLDSTAVAAALRATGSAAEISLFTFALPGLPEADETAGAMAVAARLGLPLEVIRGEQLWPLSGEAPRTLEEGPLVAYQELWEELYRRLDRRGVRVALTGSSGDHLLGGGGVLVYPDLLLRGSWLELSRQLRAERDRSGAGLPGLVKERLVRPLVRALLPRRWAARKRRLPWLRREFHQTLRECLPRDGRRWSMLPGRRLRLAALQDPMLPFSSSLMSLRAAERGVELRHPLVDHRLLEFAAALPLDQCLRAGVPKFVLRNAMRGYLPEEILRPQERVLPRALFDRGLRERQRETVRELITGMRAAELGLVDEQKLQAAYQRYLEGSGGTMFWHTLALEDWLRRYAWTRP